MSDSISNESIAAVLAIINDETTQPKDKLFKFTIMLDKFLSDNRRMATYTDDSDINMLTVSDYVRNICEDYAGKPWHAI